MNSRFVVKLFRKCSNSKSYHNGSYRFVFYDGLDTASTEDMGATGNDGLLQGVQTDGTLLVRARAQHHHQGVHQLLSQGVIHTPTGLSFIYIVYVQ